MPQFIWGLITFVLRFVAPNNKNLQKTLINVCKLNVYLFWGVQGVSSVISKHFGTLILIRKWWDFACSSARLKLTQRKGIQKKCRGIVLHYWTKHGSLFNKSSHDSNCSNNYVWLNGLITFVLTFDNCFL